MTTNLTRATAAARAGRLDDRARVRAEASIGIAAPASIVWETLADIPTWPSFVPGVTKARLLDEGPVRAESRFAWRNAGTSLTSTIERASPGDELTWTGRALWLVAVHRNVIEPLPQGCRLTSSESMAGFAASLLLPPGRLRRQLEQFVRAVAAEAERRA